MITEKDKQLYAHEEAALSLSEHTVLSVVCSLLEKEDWIAHERKEIDRAIRILKKAKDKAFERSEEYRLSTLSS